MSDKKISILMLTHNAPRYVKLTIESLNRYTQGVDYELIVLDNASKKPTRLLLKWLFRRKMIDKVIFSSHNTLFAAGNNMMAYAADPESDYYLLLNSDIEIKSSNWLEKLLEVHEGGVTAHGVVESAPTRVDGYCYMIDAELYRKFPLDDRQFQWFWAITKQQAQILLDGHTVQGYLNHEQYLHHFGGKSGGDFKGARGMETAPEIPVEWFKGNRPQILDEHTLKESADHKLLKHRAILEEKKSKYYKEPDDKKISVNINAIATYLPQFHPFPENDKAWGKGFTEWTNVTSSTPRFVGHDQPILPADLGFYDLRIPGKIKEQTELAKKYGISGFDFYYYWFSGKKIMDMPINTFLKDGSIDFNFSITWANENWARVWNDEPQNIIIQQEYKKEDALNFIKDVEKYLIDKRYIRVNGKPLITIYRPTDIPNVEKVIKTWRRYWKKKYNEELYVAYVSNFGRVDKDYYGFDAERNFLPLNWHVYEADNMQVNIDSSDLLDASFSGEVRDMEKIYHAYIDKYLENDETRFKCISPSWDNQARRKGIKGLSFINSSPDLYKYTLKKIIERERKHYKDKDIYIYVNAWNEWAEAAMLEPTQGMGHANLIATREALSE